MGTAFIYGLYVSAAIIVLSLIGYFTGMWQSDAWNIVNYLWMVFLAVGIVFGLKDRKNNDLNGVMTYGQGLGTGVIISIVAGVVDAIFTYVYITIINPDFQDVMHQKMREGMAKQGLSPEQMEQAAKIQAVWTSPLMICLFLIIATVFIGFILSLIIAAIMKSRDTDQPVASVV
jgi:hypothetical protein